MEHCQDDGERVFDDVVACDLPTGHPGPHHTVVVQENTWLGNRVTWQISWRVEELESVSVGGRPND